MTDEELMNKLIAMFGDLLANPEHEPVRFAYQVKMAKWEMANIDSKEPENVDGSN